MGDGLGVWDMRLQGGNLVSNGIKVLFRFSKYCLFLNLRFIYVRFSFSQRSSIGL